MEQTNTRICAAAVTSGLTVRWKFPLRSSPLACGYICTLTSIELASAERLIDIIDHRSRFSFYAEAFNPGPHGQQVRKLGMHLRRHSSAKRRSSSFSPPTISLMTHHCSKPVGRVRIEGPQVFWFPQSTLTDSFLFCVEQPMAQTTRVRDIRLT